MDLQDQWTRQAELKLMALDEELKELGLTEEQRVAVLTAATKLAMWAVREARADERGKVMREISAGTSEG